MVNMFNIGKANTNEADVLVGEAWSKHFNGQNDVALEQFRKLAERFTDHIDANYGLALCLKTAGQKADAAASFTKAKTLSADELAKQPEEPDRFMMLVRLCDQQISILNR